MAPGKPFGPPGRGGGRSGARRVAFSPPLVLGALCGLLITVHMLTGWPLMSSRARTRHVAPRPLAAGTNVGAVGTGDAPIGPTRAADAAAATAASTAATAAGTTPTAATPAAATPAAATPAAATPAAATPVSSPSPSPTPSPAAAAATPAAATPAAAAGGDDWRTKMADVPFTMVTGASSGYYHGLTNFVGGLHYWCPKCRLAIYDLGLDQNQIQTIKDSWCGVKIIKAPGGSNALHTYAWKPQAIADAVERFGVILWLDAGCALTGPLDGVEAQIRRDGVWNVQGQDGGMIPYVHPGTFKWFNVSKDLFEGRYSFAGGIWGFVRGSPYVDAILKPWTACAKDPACIMPPGSSLSNHRYDQAAVSIITYMVSETLNYDGSVMWPRICPADRNGGKCPPPYGLKTQPHTDVLAANAGQLNGGGCYKASKMVIWTARQSCGCYAKMAQNCTGVAGAPERLPDSTAPLDLEI